MTLNQWFESAKRSENEYERLAQRLRRPRRFATVVGMLVSFLL